MNPNEIARQMDSESGWMVVIEHPERGYAEFEVPNPRAHAIENGIPENEVDAKLNLAFMNQEGLELPDGSILMPPEA